MPPKSCHRYRHNADSEQRATVAATLPDPTKSAQLRPRLPRTSISKIPRQVHEPPDSSTGTEPTTKHHYNQDHQQQNQQLVDEQLSSSTHHQVQDQPMQATITDFACNKYLTFSKDQAASHFNALKEELNESLGKMTVDISEEETRLKDRGRHQSAAAAAATRETDFDVYDNLPYETEKVSEKIASAGLAASRHQTSPRAKSVQDRGNQQVIVNNVMHDDKCELVDVVGLQDNVDQDEKDQLLRTQSANNNNNNNNNNGSLTRQQQQPICEAFIMTGKSMLKLSCNETDSNSKSPGNNKTTAAKNQITISVTQSKGDNNATPATAVSGPVSAMAAIAGEIAASQAARAKAKEDANGLQMGPAGGTIGEKEREQQRPHELQLISASRHAVKKHNNNNNNDQPTNSNKKSKAKFSNYSNSSQKAMEFRSGILHRKQISEPRGKATGKGRRGWRRVFLVLVDLRLISRPPSADQQQLELTPKAKKQMLAQDQKNSLKLHHSFAKQSETYKKREYVFELRLADQSEFLLQAESEHDMNSWIDTINFASACLSAPAMPSAVPNDKRYLRSSQRPILPAFCTKLSYWDQLVDHEERLQRLKQDLEEHLNEAPAKKNADKHAKSEFIERIAYLRHEIRRYSIYVELMQKKSNSHEAIILSKHPQIASLEPSEKLLQRLNGGEPPKMGNGDQ